VDNQPDNYDFSHEIHEISFGSKIKKISAKGIGQFNSLGNQSIMHLLVGRKTHLFLKFLTQKLKL